MATTPNYGFVMPDPTDFVTNLPADFEIFGDAVDARIKALNPETTLGDISYRSSTADTNTRLPIGTAGQVLTVSGGVPAWTTVVNTVNFVGCSAWNSTDISVNNGTFTTVNYNSEDYDTNGFHSTTTNTSRFTIPSGQAGYYLVWANTYWRHPGTSNAGAANARWLKNGSTAYFTTGSAFSAYSTTTRNGVHTSGVLYLAVGDYVEHQIYQWTDTTLSTFSGLEHLNAGIARLGA